MDQFNYFEPPPPGRAPGWLLDAYVEGLERCYWQMNSLGFVLPASSICNALEVLAVEATAETLETPADPNTDVFPCPWCEAPMTPLDERCPECGETNEEHPEYDPSPEYPGGHHWPSYEAWARNYTGD